MEQLLYVSAHAQWMSTLDTLLQLSTLPEGIGRCDQALGPRPVALWTSDLNIASLWLQIASDPPPLREIPPNCSHLTFEVLKAGLQKDPAKRSSASSLKEKTARALEEGTFVAVAATSF